MSQEKHQYFGSESPLSGPSSGPSSGGASPSASAFLSPGSSSDATSQLSLLALNSPSSSACTSVSDFSPNEDEKLSLAEDPAKASESSEAFEAEQRRVEDELDAALAFGTGIVQREAQALALAAERLSRHSAQQDGFRAAVKLVMRATLGERGGKVILTGVGKSGIIAKKLSATFLSLGTSSMFLHPTEALHGDLGMLTPHRDVVIALSHSGSSAELMALVPHLHARKCPIIAFAGKQESPLVKAADAWIDCAAVEAWDEVPAPSSSTTVSLAMGDALAFAVTRTKGLGRDTFAHCHPAGIGSRLKLESAAAVAST